LIILSASDLCVSFGVDVILNKISFGINEGDRVGVVGVNGAGKSMLFRAINEIIKPESGEVFIAKDKKLGYLEQNAGLVSHNQIFDEMALSFSELVQAEKRLSVLELHMMEPDCDEGEHMRRVTEYTALSEKFKANGGYEYKSRIKSALCAMGFGVEKHDLPVDTLSGGQKTRLALIKMLLSEPDILMLDEPTNHLDIASTEWLEEYLKAYKKTVIVISHDRYFLDKVTKKTLEIENRACKMYPCAYTEYVKRKEEDRKNDEKHFVQQQKEIARLEAFIENQRKWNRERNIIAAESRMKAIDRMDKLEKPKALPDKVSFCFRSGKEKLLSDQMLEVMNLSKKYPGKTLFENLDFILHGSDRMFLFGANGVGKSTLLKILSGKLFADSGSFEYVKGIKIGYYDQEHQGLTPGNTILDELWNCYPDKKQSEIRGALARFLFCADDVYKKIEVLSGGEKARLTFAKLMLDEVNLLILDEPTNHLDASSREVLEEALNGYDGTLLAVSHDRYFISKLATRILEMRGDSYFDFKGGYEDFVQYNSKKLSADAKVDLEKEQSGAKTEYLRTKQEKSDKRKLEKRISDTENEIMATEERLADIQKELEEASSDYRKTAALFEESEALNRRLEELYKQLDEFMLQNGEVL